MLTLFTAIYGGIAVFSVLGHMATIYDIPIEEVAQGGPGLAYIAYPAAIAQLPVAPLWAIIFFLTLITVAIDSQFASFETYLSGLLDFFPQLRKYKMFAAGGFAATCFLCGLPLCTNVIYFFMLFLKISFNFFLFLGRDVPLPNVNGTFFKLLLMYFFANWCRLDWYSAALTFTVCAFLEVIIISYIYGLNRFFSDVELMFGSSPNKLVGFCWLFISPLLMAVSWGFISYQSNLDSNLFHFSHPFNLLKAMTFIGLAFLQPPRYDYTDYEYPDWGIAIGWCVAAISFLPTPIFFLYGLFKTGFSIQVIFCRFCFLY